MAVSVPFFTCCQGAFVCMCDFWVSSLFFWSELCCEWDLWHLVHSLCISVTLWAPSISVRGGTASQSKPTVLSLNICSLLSEMRKSLSFPSMWRLKWRACLKTDCAKLGVYLNSMSTLLTWKYILNWEVSFNYLILKAVLKKTSKQFKSDLICLKMRKSDESRQHFCYKGC